MSPDRRAVGDLIASATARARALLVARAVASAAIAAAAALVLTRFAGLTTTRRLWTVAIVEFVAAAIVGLRRRRTVTRTAIVRALERAQPASRNLLTTADELASGALAAPRPMRERIFADAVAVARDVDLRAAVPSRPAIVAAMLAAAAWAVVGTPPLWQRVADRVAPDVLHRAIGGGATSAQTLRVTIAIRPPAYAGLKDATLVDPAQVQAIEGSTLEIRAESAADRVALDHDGATRALTRGADGAFTGRVDAAKTGYLLLAAGAARRAIPLVVVPDALPAVRLTAPGRDLIYAGGNPRIAFDVRATDDLGLRSLTLRYTKVSGSGENFEFQDGEIPLEVARTNPREWTGRALRSLAELGLQEGEMLVYRGVAADARPGDRAGSSDAFFIEISKLGVAAGDAFTLPEEDSRYALSQQMLIIKTDRLQQRRTTLGADAFHEEALNLAVEQRMIRAEFVFMLGGEVENEEIEAEQSTELQEGRLQNHGQRDLRAATVAMSQAEKALTAASTADALVAERAAVVALQRAFARDRYILRALATRSQLDAARRLTGNVAGVTDFRRPLVPAPENRRAALLEDLVRGLADLAREGGRDTATNRASLLAVEAIRIDPASSALREVATALQRIQDAPRDERARARALSAAVAAAALESRRAHADATLDASVPGPDLTGAFIDALRGPR